MSTYIFYVFIVFLASTALALEDWVKKGKDFVIAYRRSYIFDALIKQTLLSIIFALYYLLTHPNSMMWFVLLIAICVPLMISKWRTI